MKFFLKIILYLILFSAVFFFFYMILEKISPMDFSSNWAWYLSRSSGILGYIFLWLTILLGLAIRNPLLKKIYNFDTHCFLGAASVFWSLVHGTSLLFDPMIKFGVGDIAIPFFSQNTIVDPVYMGLGIFAFYFLAIITITSYLRANLYNWFWRVLHFLNPVAFVFVVLHGYFNGTDINNNFFIGSSYLFSAFVLVLVYVINLIVAIVRKIENKEMDRHSV